MYISLSGICLAYGSFHTHQVHVESENVTVSKQGGFPPGAEADLVL